MDNAYFQRLLDQYGRVIQTQLRLENGVCAIQDAQQQELAVIELPPPGDMLVLHCAIPLPDEVRHDPELYPLLLAMNFEMDAMRGCWLALDPEARPRLCTQHTLQQMDASAFNSVINAFIEQGRQVRAFVPQLLERLEQERG